MTACQPFGRVVRPVATEKKTFYRNIFLEIIVPTFYYHRFYLTISIWSSSSCLITEERLRSLSGLLKQWHLPANKKWSFHLPELVEIFSLPIQSYSNGNEVNNVSLVSKTRAANSSKSRWKTMAQTIVADPDPYVFVPPGSGSIIGGTTDPDPAPDFSIVKQK